MSTSSLRRYDIVGAAVVSLAALAVFLGFLTLLDSFTQAYDVRVVATYSMEPNVPQGSLVFVKKGYLPPIGGVGLYHYSEQPDKHLLHRVIEYEDGVALFKGDNAKGIDRVPLTNIDGVLAGGLPLIGKLRFAVEDPVLVLIIIVIIVALLA